MNRSRSTALRAGIAPVAALLFQCGSLVPQTLTGGSGAGNPGGTVAISLKAHIEAGVAKTSSATNQDYTIIDSANPIVATDKGGLKLTISQISLNSADIRFVLDSAISPKSLLPQQPFHEEPLELSYDSNCIILPGPFQFNAMEMVCDTSIPMVQLPIARYTGVAIYFERDSGDFEQHLFRHSRIAMAGTFVLDGAVHPFTIDINRTLRPYYRFAGGIFTLRKNDTTHIELLFDVRRWFSNVDFSSYINKGLLSFDPQGCLHISSFAEHYFSQEIEFIISEDFILSGRLVVY